MNNEDLQNEFTNSVIPNNGGNVVIETKVPGAEELPPPLIDPSLNAPTVNINNPVPIVEEDIIIHDDTAKEPDKPLNTPFLIGFIILIILIVASIPFIVQLLDK